MTQGQKTKRYLWAQQTSQRPQCFQAQNPSLNFHFKILADWLMNIFGPLWTWQHQHKVIELSLLVGQSAFGDCSFFSFLSFFISFRKFIRTETYCVQWPLGAIACLQSMLASLLSSFFLSCFLAFFFLVKVSCVNVVLSCCAARVHVIRGVRYYMLVCVCTVKLVNRTIIVGKTNTLMWYTQLVCIECCRHPNSHMWHAFSLKSYSFQVCELLDTGTFLAVWVT